MAAWAWYKSFLVFGDGVQRVREHKKSGSRLHGCSYSMGSRDSPAFVNVGNFTFLELASILINLQLNISPFLPTIQLRVEHSDC